MLQVFSLPSSTSSSRLIQIRKTTDVTRNVSCEIAWNYEGIRAMNMNHRTIRLSKWAYEHFLSLHTISPPFSIHKLVNFPRPQTVATHPTWCRLNSNFSLAHVILPSLIHIFAARRLWKMSQFIKKAAYFSSLGHHSLVLTLSHSTVRRLSRERWGMFRSDHGREERQC